MEAQSGAEGPRIIDLDPQPAVAVRVTAPTVELGSLFDQYLPELADRIADLGGMPAGPAYARYHDINDQSVDVEIGIPVVAPVANLRTIDEAVPGEAATSTLPRARVAVVIHPGSYDGLNDTYRQLGDWIRAQGLVPGDGPWESYVTDMTEVADPADLRTEVIWPLA